MQDSIELMDIIDETDLVWLLETGSDRILEPDTVLIEEDTQPKSLFFVYTGLLSASRAFVPERHGRMMGPGEVIGLKWFVDCGPVYETVRAVEKCHLLEIPTERLLAELERNSGFASRFYHAAAQITSRHLREAELFRDATLARQWEESGSDAGEWRKTTATVNQFKSLARDAIDEGTKNKGGVSEETADKVREKFASLVAWLDDVAGDSSEKPEAERKLIGRRVQEDLLPYVLLTQTAKRFYSKPRGYAGDFHTIELVYQNRAAGEGHTGELIDRCFLDSPQAQAVRNRRELLAGEILKTMENAQETPARVLSIACGPAREVFDVYATCSDTGKLSMVLIDMDPRALEFVTESLEKNRIDGDVRLHNENVLYLAMGRRTLEAQPFDLIYSIGLIDYFTDKPVRRLIDYAYGLLKPGGKLILGNFHPNNRGKAFMDYVLEWKLLHRSEADLNRLFTESAFGRPCTDIRFENEGINMFAECKKESVSSAG